MYQAGSRYVESGTADVEGVTRIGAVIAERLRALGGSVELVPPAADPPRITSLPDQFARLRGRALPRTPASAGNVYNSIPAAAMAIGDMRADDPDDLKTAAIRERIRIG